MVRNLLGLSKSTLVVVRGLAKQQVGRISSVVVGDEEAISLKRNTVDYKKTKNIEECEWVPHPRSGIYFPKGHEWVMEDVPITAASVAPTYWLRGIDGVEADPRDG